MWPVSGADWSLLFVWLQWPENMSFNFFTVPPGTGGTSQCTGRYRWDKPVHTIPCSAASCHHAAKSVYIEYSLPLPVAGEGDSVSSQQPSYTQPVLVVYSSQHCIVSACVLHSRDPSRSSPLFTLKAFGLRIALGLLNFKFCPYFKGHATINLLRSCSCALSASDSTKLLTTTRRNEHQLCVILHSTTTVLHFSVA